MKQKAQHLMKHPLIKGSTIVVFGGLLANFFNFLYNIFMIRTLSAPDYGVLASIISIITFPALIVTAVNPVIMRFAAEYFVNGDEALLKGLYKKFFYFLFMIGIVIFAFLLIFLSQIANFLHITNYFILFLADIVIFLSFISIINLSFLQAKLAFSFQVIVSLTASVIKFLLGILLIFFGYSINGAFSAILISTIGSYLISFLPFKFLFSTKAKNLDIQTKEFFRYGIPTALTLLGLTSFISTDIILVKHYFDPFQAGQYAGLSLIGRIIFFISAPIGGVMFPIVVQKHTKGDSFSNTFKVAIGLVTIPSLLLTFFYYFFPKFSILFFLKRTDYLSITPYLGIFALYITSYCLVYLFATFYLSIKKTVIYLPILIAAVMQIALITIYHHSFLQIIMISFVLILLLMIGFLVYYPYATKK